MPEFEQTERKIPDKIFNDLNGSQLRILNVTYPINSFYSSSSSEIGGSVRGIAIGLSSEGAAYYQSLYDETMNSVSNETKNNSDFEGIYFQNNGVTILFRPKDKFGNNSLITVINSGGLSEGRRGQQQLNELLESNRFVGASGYVPFSGDGMYDNVPLSSLYDRFK